jgi:hypothetical protein
MTIDPRWSFWLSMTLGVLGFLSGAGVQFTDLGLDPHVVKQVLAFNALMLGIGSVANGVLAAIPSPSGQTKGFYLGPKPADPAAKP